MRFLSLVSGSSGNASLMATDSTKILVDCGISAKKTDTLLKEAGIEKGLHGIDALILTHEHSDHIKGVKRLMSAYGIPVYGSSGTLSALSAATKDEYFKYAGRELMEPVRADFEFSIGDIHILPFNIYHDAAEPYAYRFEIYEGDKCTETALMTDCGHFDDYICDHLTELDAVLMEANHDPVMLQNGPYPMMLKRRIISGRGHLSNASAGELLAKIFQPKLKKVKLGHLSKENNTPELAVATVRDTLISLRGTETAGLVDIAAASPEILTEVYAD